MAQAPLSPEAASQALTAVKVCGGNVSAAAKLLGIPRPTLVNRLRSAVMMGAKPEMRLVDTGQYEEAHLTIKNGVAVFSGDDHFMPGQIPVAHAALINVLGELGNSVKAQIKMGDSLDFAGISKHPRQGWEGRLTVRQELEITRERFDELREAAPKAKRIRLKSNHDIRFEARLAMVAPEFEGLTGFRLKDHLPHWEEVDRAVINEDLFALHGWHGGIHAGWNNVVKGADSHVVTGHTHLLGCNHLKGFRKTRYAIQTGMIADAVTPHFRYAKGAPTNWQSGFAVLTWADGELLYPEFCVVRDDGKAYFRGKRVA